MSVRKLTLGLMAAAALLAGQRAAKAQEYLPVADPFRFDPNFRWFEPVFEQDLADMKPSKRASTGWFGTFDRMNLYFSRPDIDILRSGASNDFSDGLDGGWGNRLQFGYMLDNDTGWSATWMNIGSPNSFETLWVERLDREPEEDDEGGGGDDDDVANDPANDFANRSINPRLYELQDTVNDITADSFEINKTWRLEPYHYGGILEPMIGLRYMMVRDRFRTQTYTRQIDEDNDIFNEILLTNRASTRNTMFGGQLGARYFRYQNRVRLSAEFRGFAMANWQSHRRVTEQLLTEYDGIGIGSEIISELATRNGLQYRDNDEFVVGFDARADMSYQLTNMFALRGGFQMINLGRGIWRGQINDPNDQSLLMLGVTFGFEINR